jgi:hypothetical protein
VRWSRRRRLRKTSSGEESFDFRRKRANAPEITKFHARVMLGEVIDLVSGIAMGEPGDKAKHILGRVYEYFAEWNG